MSNWRRQFWTSALEAIVKLFLENGNSCDSVKQCNKWFWWKLRMTEVFWGENSPYKMTIIRCFLDKGYSRISFVNMENCTLLLVWVLQTFFKLIFEDQWGENFVAKIYGDIVCFDGFSKHLFIKWRKLKSLAGLPYNVTPRYRKITGLPIKRPLVS